MNRNKGRFLAILLACILLLISCTTSNDTSNTANNQENTENSASESQSVEVSEEESIVESSEKVEEEPIEESSDSTGVGTAQGYGGPVTVTLTVNEGNIKSVDVEGDKETEGIGTNAIEEMPQKMVDENSIAVDVTSGATYTSNAILSATKVAYAEATGESTEDTKSMNPGTYRGEGKGYGGPLVVEVTVSEDSIESINVVEQSETIHIGSHAVDQVPEAIVEYQSTGVDTVTGASITTNAIKSAVNDAISQSGAPIEQFTAPIDRPVSNEVTTYEVDLVIAGAGISGLTAASYAAEEGQEVIVLEKLSITGGCANTSLGLLMVAETEDNADLALTENLEPLSSTLERWKSYTEEYVLDSDYTPDYDRLAIMLDRSLDTIGWFRDLGADFEPYNTIADGMPTYEVSVEGYDGKGAGQLLTMLKDKVEEKGVKIFTDTPVTQILQDDEGNVIGLLAESKDGKVEVLADNVIIATGGYAANEEMMKANMPSVKEYNTITSIGNVGDGIHMIEEVGGVQMEHQWIHNSRPGYSNNLKSYSQYITMFQHLNSPFEDHYEDPWERLVIDSEGNRFMNEGEVYSTQVMNMLSHDTFPYFVIFSNLDDFATNIIEEGIPSGEVYKGETIEELALELNMDPQTLVTTTERYDEMCTNGDEDFGKDPEQMTNPVGDEGPFYAIHYLPGSNDTLGGVVTNDHYQVLDAEGNVIPNLYATGSMSNGMYYNQYYFSGSQITFGATSGIIAIEAILGIEE